MRQSFDMNLGRLKYIDERITALGIDGDNDEIARLKNARMKFENELLGIETPTKTGLPAITKSDLEAMAVGDTVDLGGRTYKKDVRNGKPCFVLVANDATQTQGQEKKRGHIRIARAGYKRESNGGEPPRGEDGSKVNGLNVNPLSDRSIKSGSQQPQDALAQAEDSRLANMSPGELKKELQSEDLDGRKYNKVMKLIENPVRMGARPADDVKRDKEADDRIHAEYSDRLKKLLDNDRYLPPQAKKELLSMSLGELKEAKKDKSHGSLYSRFPFGSLEAAIEIREDERKTLHDQRFPKD